MKSALVSRHDTLSEELASISTVQVGRVSVPSKTDRIETGSTLFIGDVDQLPANAQEMVMYFLDVVYSSNAPRPGRELCAARIVAATAEDHGERVAGGLFRTDLFYRLNTIHLRLPLLWDGNDSRLHSLLASL